MSSFSGREEPAAIFDFRAALPFEADVLHKINIYIPDNTNILTEIFEAFPIDEGTWMWI